MEPVESKQYSWAWVTADRLLSHGPCELLQAHLVVSGGNGTVTLYDGENTSGDIILKMQAAAKTGLQFHPKEPIYCRRGLYVGSSASLTGVFVQWRELPGS